jgi:hypothetical protein
MIHQKLPPVVVITTGKSSCAPALRSPIELFRLRACKLSQKGGDDFRIFRNLRNGRVLAITDWPRSISAEMRLGLRAPQLSQSTTVRTTANAKNAAVSMKNSQSKFRLITMIPPPGPTRSIGFPVVRSNRSKCS